MAELAERIHTALPEWARYEGYATRAIAAYLAAAGLGLLAALFYMRGFVPQSAAVAALGGIGLTLGSYYRDAAKLRVECSHCGESVHGNDVCPHCGGRTYMRDTE